MNLESIARKISSLAPGACAPSGEDEARADGCGYLESTMTRNKTRTDRSTASRDNQEHGDAPRPRAERFADTYQTVGGRTLLTDDLHAPGRWIVCAPEDTQEVPR